MVREGLVHLLEVAFDVVAAVGDGRTMVSEAERLRPDVVVLDVGMPLLNGIEATKQIRTALPAAKVVFLTQQAGKGYVQAAFRLGASAYLLKNAAAAELVPAISDVLCGRRILSSELRQRFGDPGPVANGTPFVIFGPALSPPQREVLQLLAEGKGASEIAHILGFSVKTAEFHTAAIMEELGLRTTAELRRYCSVHEIAGQTK